MFKIVGISDILTEGGATKLIHALLIQQPEVPLNGTKLSFKGRGREHIVFRVGNKAVEVALLT